VPKLWANTKVDNFMHLMYTGLACQAFCIRVANLHAKQLHNLLAASQQTRQLQVLAPLHGMIAEPSQDGFHELR
jgi:hypothetical protein